MYTAGHLTTTMSYAHVEAHDLKSVIAKLEMFVSSQAPEELPPDAHSTSPSILASLLAPS